MGYAYAYVQNGIVLEVEKRTLQDTDDYPIGKYYHGSLLPYFVEIRPGENAPADQEVRKGWRWQNNQFSEPEPFSINPETGEMYLPDRISAADFWAVFQDNLRLRNELAEVQSQGSQMESQLVDTQLALCDVYELLVGGDG